MKLVSKTVKKRWVVANNNNNVININKKIDKVSLETLEESIEQIFSAKHPFRAHDHGVGRVKKQNPTVILL